ncbi:MAG: spermidine/putrescine ABC transporter substrate-binding protein, partial [Candidatus Marinimicrobia bacterium]|nr:spermidine/putrescine ABC transporter substrate-binding protein [Candidatus Neomarinimicrobiota bacterium]
MKLRSMILRGGLPALVLGLGLLTAGCGGGKPVLHIYNWTSYLKPELLRDFEQAHNCRVRMDHYDSNEAMYAKLKAGATGYDVIFPSSYMARIMNQQDMLQPIRHDLIPNLAHLDRDFLELTEDREMRYSVPYMVTASGIGYRADQLEAPEPTWGLFADPRFAGRMTLLNDMRETIGAALKFLGYSLNTTDETQLEAALEVLLTWKANIAKFESEQYKHGLASAEFFLAHGYNGDVLQVMEESPDVAWFFPQEGVSLASDDMVIPADARQVELAHAF